MDILYYHYAILKFKTSECFLTTCDVHIILILLKYVAFAIHIKVHT